MTFVYLKEQQIADKAALDYLAIKNSPHTSIQLHRAENNLITSLEYYIQFSTRKFFSCREDLRQVFCECVLQALKTFDPTIHNSFTYWLDGYLNKMKRRGIKQIKINHYEKQMDIIPDGPSVFDKEILPSPEKVCMIKESLNALSEADYNLLLIWLDSDSFEDAAWKLNISKQAVHSRVCKIIEKMKAYA